jgi:tripartite-type tricarboxylate transporter receptor subunit TctC
MKTTRRSLAALLLAAPAVAQEARPIRLVVPFAAGTTTDVLARMLAPALAPAGTPVVVENRSGAGGNIGSAAVAHAAPDGNTLIFGTSGTHGVNASLYADQGYDPVADFAPVAAFVRAPAVLAVRPQLGPSSLAELVALAKRRSLSFASAGNGTTGHLSQALLNLRAGIETVHIPYRSGAQAVTDLLSGQVDGMFYHYLPFLPFFQTGALKPLALTGAARTPGLPEVPTMAEAGLQDFVVEGWWAVWAPRGTPAATVARLNAAVNAYLADPAAQAALAAQGVEPIGGTPEELGARTRAEVAKWRPVVAAAGIRAD